jgi:hypothetical protein
MATLNLAAQKAARLKNSVTPKLPETIPNFITPQTILDMSDEVFEKLLASIRIKRLAATLIYQKSMEEKANLANAKLAAAMEKKCDQIIKELEGTFKKFEKLELRINELRALRLQAGLDFDPEGLPQDE